MTPDEKQALANEAEKALSHDLVTNAREEALRNHGGKEGDLLWCSFAKVAMYTASVSRAQALGINPDELRLSSEESRASLQARARRSVELGKPTFLIDEAGVTRLD